MSTDIEAAVSAFLGKRPEYVRALKATPGDGDQVDYWRWQGHAEARRQLCDAIGGPCRCGHHTSRSAS
jgi:hypothetical protein